MKPQPNPESGYALLLVFAMAAIVAITLYTQVPRAAFEAQRDKEQLLMDRGHEYVRAVTLFVHKFNRFPATMEELENTNNVRFLRRRYTDPMTGKADWRLLHAGPGGVITDSVLTTKKADDASTPQSFITELQSFGAAQSGDPEGVNLATRRRMSDQPGAPGDPNSGAVATTDPGFPSGNPNPGIPNPATSNTGYNGPVMVLPNGTIVPANSSGAALAGMGPGGSSVLPGAPGAPGASGALNFAGVPLPTGVAIQQNGQNQMPYNLQQGGPPNGAASLINQILTTPRPGGLNGLNGGQTVQTPNNSFGTSPTGTSATTTGSQQQVVGAGLAGVASKREQEGIKTYNEQTKYNRWEFVYDIAKDPTKNGQQNAGASGATGGQTRPGPQPSTGLTPAGPGTAGPGTMFGK